MTVKEQQDRVRTYAARLRAVRCSITRRQYSQQGRFQGVRIPSGTSLWWNTKLFWSASGHSTHCWACRPVYRDTESLVVKVSNLIHLQPVRYIRTCSLELLEQVHTAGIKPGHNTLHVEALSPFLMVPAETLQSSGTCPNLTSNTISRDQVTKRQLLVLFPYPVTPTNHFVTHGGPVRHLLLKF